MTSEKPDKPTHAKRPTERNLLSLQVLKVLAFTLRVLTGEGGEVDTSGEITSSGTLQISLHQGFKEAGLTSPGVRLAGSQDGLWGDVELSRISIFVSPKKIGKI